MINVAGVSKTNTFLYPTLLGVIAMFAFASHQASSGRQLDEASLASVVGRSDLSATIPANLACANATFQSPTQTDCASEAAQTPCGSCPGYYQRVAKTSGSGGPGIVASGGNLPCNSSYQYIGLCDGEGNCQGAATRSRCINTNIPAYIYQ